jgi:hypothetical protein
MAAGMTAPRPPSICAANTTICSKRAGWTAEDFIARAGTESSISHKPYQVRCSGKEAEASASWLQAELKRYRNRQ